MVDFLYPESLEEALLTIEKKDCILLAGGTDLMVRYENWSGLPASFPKSVLHIAHLPELHFIKEQKDSLFIGSGMTITEIIEDKRTPALLTEAISGIAAPGIRNLGTLAGNIANASPAGDSLPPLCVLDAKIRLISSTGERDIKLCDFIVAPGKTVKRADEIILGIVIPKEKSTEEGKELYFYRKVGTRKANALSKLSCAMKATIKDGKIYNFRASCGAVSARPIDLREQDASIDGTPAAELFSAWQSIQSDYNGQIKPIDDQRSTAIYRKRIAIKLLEAGIEEFSKG